jgi:serine/threonine-protein kinase
MDKTVAIKVLRPSLAADEKIVARFSREARAASRITHPNAISVTDFGEDESGHVFLVMEYLSGKTLRHVIREEGPLPLARVVDITRQIGDALNAAHEQGVIHRDLKSDNIMLLDTMSGDHAKVLDFGIAKINEPEGEVDTGLTAPNLVIGTPQYMSPEQCSQDSEIDSRSDIYSLGVILYEMLVGHVPFSGDSPTIVMMKHLQEPVPSVLEERSDLPASVARVVARAMAKVKDNRYQTVAELIEDLTIAARMTIHSIGPVGVTSTAETVVRREDPYEVTEVRPREDPPPAIAPVQRREPVIVSVSGAMPPPAPAATGFNPVKVLIPSVIALLVVFAAIYALTRNSTPGEANSNQQVPSLAADPYSQPVQPAQPATGKGEEGIPSGGQISPPAIASPSASVAASPAATEDFTPDANANANANTNTNSNENSNGNSNRKAPALPEPTRSVVPADQPPPVPSATKPPAEKPSPSATPN